MWKTVFCFGLLFSLEGLANTCNIKTIDDVAALFKNSSEEKKINKIGLELAEKSELKAIQRGRPELEVTFDADKSELKNNELGVSLLFDIDHYRRYGVQKKMASIQAHVLRNESESAANQRLLESALSYFKVAQNSYFNQKIEDLLDTVKSSEEAYDRRMIKGRDDELVLNSLRLIRDNLVLKKAMLEDQIEFDQSLLAFYKETFCQINYEDMGNLLAGVPMSIEETFSGIDENNSLKLQELKLKEEFILNQVDFESPNRLSNLKIGPTFSREVSERETETRFGLGLTMDFPIFDNSNNTQFSDVIKQKSSAEYSREKLIAINQHRYLLERLKKYSSILKKINSTKKTEYNILKMKKSFDQGIISPLVYLDSYRSYVDYLETSQEAQLKVFETYLKLRGAYVKNTTF